MVTVANITVLDYLQFHYHNFIIVMSICQKCKTGIVSHIQRTVVAYLYEQHASAYIT